MNLALNENLCDGLYCLGMFLSLGVDGWEVGNIVFTTFCAKSRRGPLVALFWEWAPLQ